MKTTNTAHIAFEATPYILGKWLVVKLPEEASKQLPSRGQVMVKGALNGHEFGKVLEPDGSLGHWFKVDETLQQTAGAEAGKVVSLEISPSKDWPEPEIPEDFSRALANAPDKVQELWKKITPMARWEWVRWVNATSNVETRDRRVDVSISKMQSGKRRPCCFNLSACTDAELAKNGRLVEVA